MWHCDILRKASAAALQKDLSQAAAAAAADDDVESLLLPPELSWVVVGGWADETENLVVRSLMKGVTSL